MFKRFILLGIIIIGMLVTSFYALANQDEKSSNFSSLNECDKLKNGQIKQLNGNTYAKSKSGKCYRLHIFDDDTNLKQSQNNDTQIEKSRFNKDQIIEWFVIGFVITIIIAIMSIPISLLWRFKFKISACLFGIVALLSVIAVPFIFYL